MLLMPLLPFLQCEEVRQNGFVSHQVTELISDAVFPTSFFFFFLKASLVLCVLVIPYCLLPVSNNNISSRLVLNNFVNYGILETSGFSQLFSS